MALFNCPECGKQISDQAASCPNCGCPIKKNEAPDAPVRVKLSTLRGNGIGSRQRAYIYTSVDNVLWEGYTGEIAELDLQEKTEVTVEYALSIMQYGGRCTGVIDPSQGKKYNVSARLGIMKTILQLQRVDVIDAD